MMEDSDSKLLEANNETTDFKISNSQDKRQKLNELTHIDYNQKLKSSAASNSDPNNTCTNSDEMNRDDVEVAEDIDDPPIASSFSNIIPPHLQKTLGSYGLYVTHALDQTVEIVNSKASELSNSEAVRNLTSQTTNTLESVVKGWEASVDTMLNGVDYLAVNAAENVPSLSQVSHNLELSFESFIGLNICIN